MNSGQGFVLLDIFTIICVFMAGLCQLAIYMDKSLPETKAVDTARMLMFAGYMIIGVRWSFLFVNSGMDLRITPSLVAGVALTAIAQIILAADRLLNGNRNGEPREPTTSKA